MTHIDNLPGAGARTLLHPPLTVSLGRLTVMVTHAEHDETGQVVAYLGRTLSSPARNIRLSPHLQPQERPC